MSATPNRATQIIAENLLDQMYECFGGTPCGWSGKNAENYYEQEMISFLNGDYDFDDDAGLDYPDWLPLVSTPAIRETIDWEYIAEKANDYEYDREIEWLFGDDE